jgi:type IV pilus assembly protein PilY1
VDLTPVVKDLDVLEGESTVWKTILVSGLGKGGKGYFAIDITGITNTSFPATDSDVAARVRWEYPRPGTLQEEIDDMGYTFSRPSIVRSNDPSKPWVMVTGNGYNSKNSHAVLFIIDPMTGTLIKKLDTGVVTTSAQCNGLSTPIAIDPNSNGTVDYVYAGDLYGNMWKFDLTSSNFNEWEIAFGDDYSGDGQINYNKTDAIPDAPAALFTAKDPLGLNQPITTKPDVMKHCEKDGYMVVFGTGRYLGETDFVYYDTQSIYGIWDYGDDTDDNEYIGAFNRTYTQTLSNQPDTVTLLRQTEVSGEYFTASGQEIRILTDYAPIYSTVPDPDNVEGEPAYLPDLGPPGTCNNDVDDDDNGVVDDAGECISHAGWYVDVDGGERVANDLMIREGKIVMIGFVPEKTPCGTGGTSIVMELNACTGGRLSEPQLDINQDQVIDYSDLILIETTEGPRWVAPTGISYDGRLMPPAILRTEEEEIKYFSTNVGSIVTLREKAVSLGITYWLELE